MKRIYHINDIDTVASEVLAIAKAKCIIFNAPMGSGKTTLIKALCKSLGVTEEVSSPTFSLVNEYKGKDTSIFHFDLYRIENTMELQEIGIEDYLIGDHYFFIEWPEFVIPFLTDYVVISLQTNSMTERTITLTH